jgi:hypothetical protein
MRDAKLLVKNAKSGLAHTTSELTDQLIRQQKLHTHVLLCPSNDGLV